MSWLHFKVKEYGSLNHEFCVDSKSVIFELKGRNLFVGTFGVYEFDTHTHAEEAWLELIHRLESGEAMITLPYEFEDLTSYSMRSDYD